jgi:hypothetical protein
MTVSSPYRQSLATKGAKMSDTMNTSKMAFLVCKLCKGTNFTVITILDHETELGKIEVNADGFKVSALECTGCGEPYFPGGKAFRL